MTNKAPPIVRIFQKTIKQSTGCIERTSSIDRTGYAKFFYKGSSRWAHRVSFELHNGEIPTGLDVLHKCDNPLCVNPEHLFLGNHFDNMQDMIRKGRKKSIRGTSVNTCKLSEHEVIMIRNDNRPQRLIAKEYGINQAQVHRIKQRLSWRHI